MEVYALEEIHATAQSPVKLGIDGLEQYLITQYKPCLNRTFNNRPTLLPLRYIKESAIAIEGVILE